MKWLRRAAAAVGILLGLWLVAWLGVPPLLKWQMEKQLGALLGRSVTVGAVQFRPWALELLIERFAVAGSGAGAAPALSIERLRANATLGSLVRLAPVLEAVEVDAPRVRVAHLGDGRYDFDDVVQRLSPPADAPPPEAAAPARFAVYNVQVRDGEVEFDDRPVGVKQKLEALNLALPFLSSLPADVELKVEPRLAFTLNGTAFDTGAQSTPFARDRATVLNLRIGALDLKPYLPYQPASLPVRVRDASVAAELQVHLAAPAGEVPSIRLQGRLAVDKLDVADAAGAPLLAWRHLGVTLRDVQPLMQRVDLEQVQLEGAHLHLARDAQGELNLQRLAGPAPAAPAPGAAASAPAPQWNVAVGSVEVSDARVDWADAAPRAELGLEALRFTMQDLHWPAREPAPFTMSAQLRGSAATLRVEGRAHDRRAEVQAELDQLSLATLAPYLAAHLKPRVEGRLGARAALVWAADAPGLEARLEQATLEDLRLLGDGAGAAPLASLKRLQVGGVELATAARSVQVATLRLEQPSIDLLRDKRGELNAAAWSVEGEPASTPPAAEAPPWRLRLADLALVGGRVAWSDETTAKPVRLLVDELKAAVQGFEWAGPTAAAAPAKVQLSARALRGAAPGRRAAASLPGRVDWRGQVGAVPLVAKGALRVDKFALDALEPYIAGDFQVETVRALADFRGEVDVARSAAGLRASVKGDAALSDLRLLSRVPPGSLATPDELLTFRSLTLSGLAAALAPQRKPQVSVDAARLADFYSRLVISESGSFNLQDVAPPGAGAPAPEAAASAPQAAASAPAPPPEAPLPLDLAVGGIELVNGKVDFTDRFIRPNYSAALTELNGKLGAFRSDTREMATLDLTGRAAGTAQLAISGSVNPTARPLALDIRARATDLELAPLSPYAGKYAGYAIERGKLSMEVAYKIEPDGKLDARNQLVLNQLTFGEKIESPDATKLPVLFAVSLLKDRHGNIDLDLPISGSINDPQFSVFGLVLKVLGNLIVKAVTAPFALFSGGGGPDLSIVEFRPGTAQLADSAAAVIDKVAQALLDRPALKLTVTGAADAAGERAAMQRRELDRRLLAQLRGEGGDDAAEPDPKERLRVLREVYQRADIPDKPRNLIGLQKDLPAAEMETMLLSRIQVSDETARELATQRGIAVRDALIARGLPSERLFLAAPKLQGPEGDATGWTPRATLSLSAN